MENGTTDPKALLSLERRPWKWLRLSMLGRTRRQGLKEQKRRRKSEMNKCKWPGDCAFKNTGYCNYSDLCPYNCPNKSLNDLVFGDEIEVKTDEGWKSAKIISLYNSAIWLILDGSKTPIFKSFTFAWRFPMKSRMRKGQPVFVGRNESIRIFSHLKGGKLYAFSSPLDTCSVFAWELWRLPTKAELEEIGHADGGWLTKEDEND